MSDGKKERESQCGPGSHSGVRGSKRMWDLSGPEVHRLTSQRSLKSRYLTGQPVAHPDSPGGRKRMDASASLSVVLSRDRETGGAYTDV